MAITAEQIDEEVREKNFEFWIQDPTYTRLRDQVVAASASNPEILSSEGVWDLLRSGFTAMHTNLPKKAS